MQTEQTARNAMDLLKSGKIPSSVKGLTYFEIRPDLVSTNGPEYKNFDLIKKCYEIMQSDEKQVETGKQFLSALYRDVAKPAFIDNSGMPTKETGENLLHWAAATGQVQIFNFQELAELTVADKKGRTPMDWAVEYGQFEVVQQLIDLDVKPSEKSLPAVMKMLCGRGDIERAQKILGPGITPMDWAVQNGQKDLAQQLIKLKVQPSQQSLPALIKRVADDRDIPLAIQILASGATPSVDSLKVLMTTACDLGDVDLAGQILDACPSDEEKEALLNPGNGYQGSPYLLQACQDVRKTPLARLLLPHVNRPMAPLGQSSLDAVIQQDNAELVVAILKREEQKRGNAGVASVLNSPEYQPLVVAAVRKGNPAVVDALVKAGADPLPVVALAHKLGNAAIIQYFAPLETAEKNFHECREFIAFMRQDFSHHKESVLPRTKLKEKLVPAALAILEGFNNGAQRGQLTIKSLLDTHFDVAELHLEDKEAATYNAYLRDLNPNYEGTPKTSLQEILEFHRKPAVAKKRGDPFFQLPASAQHVLREFEPAAIKLEAIKFIDRVLKSLDKKMDIAGTRAKSATMERIRLKKIADLTILKSQIEIGDIHSLKDLCELGGRKNLLHVLNTHRDPAKQGKKDTNSYEKFKNLFRLEQHPEIDAAALKKVEAIVYEPVQDDFNADFDSDADADAAADSDSDSDEGFTKL